MLTRVFNKKIRQWLKSNPAIPAIILANFRKFWQQVTFYSVTLFFTVYLSRTTV
nr:MAG TPA: copper resistance protein [Caudoviricetes sp.]